MFGESQSHDKYRTHSFFVVTTPYYSVVLPYFSQNIGIFKYSKNASLYWYKKIKTNQLPLNTVLQSWWILFANATYMYSNQK